MHIIMHYAKSFSVVETTETTDRASNITKKKKMNHNVVHMHRRRNMR